MKIIDPHIHLFDLNNGNYHWLKDDNEPLWAEKKLIQRNFKEQDLLLTPPLILAGFVHIEAGFDNQQPWRELTWLEQHCVMPFKSIAFSDVSQVSDKFLSNINKLQCNASFSGIRYIFNNQTYTSKEIKNIKENLRILANKEIIFELQLPSNQAVFEQVLACLLIEPNLKIIINHAAFPPKLQEKALYLRWLSNITKLSQRKNTYIKCSGWEMVNKQYNMHYVLNIITTCLRLFGENNVMLASNFPLTLFTTSYQEYWQNLYKLLTDNFTLKQSNNLCYSNAKHVYDLNV